MEFKGAADGNDIGFFRIQHFDIVGVNFGRIASFGTDLKKAVGRFLTAGGDCTEVQFRQILQEEIVDPLKLNGMFFGIDRDQFDNNVAFIDAPAGMEDDIRMSHNEFCVLNGLNPSSNGSINAESLAKMYASLIGSGMDGIRLVSEKTMEEATILCLPIVKDFKGIPVHNLPGVKILGAFTH